MGRGLIESSRQCASHLRRKPGQGGLTSLLHIERRERGSERVPAPSAGPCRLGLQMTCVFHALAHGTLSETAPRFSGIAGLLVQTKALRVPLCLHTHHRTRAGRLAAAHDACECLLFPSVALSRNPRKAHCHPEADSRHWDKTARSSHTADTPAMLDRCRSPDTVSAGNGVDPCQQRVRGSIWGTGHSPACSSLWGNWERYG